MGLIKAAKDSIGGLLEDQWREFFYCDSLSNDILAVKGRKKVDSRRNSNTRGNDNIISDGSLIAVNEGQCMMIVEQGEVVELCADAGEYVFDTSIEPSLLYGELNEQVERSFKELGRRFSFGGNPGKDQRVYYFNLKEIMSNLFGTPNPVPFRVVDQNIGLDVDISIRCNGEYSFRIIDPLLFYKNVCGNVQESYSRSQITGQMKAELLTALQPAFSRISMKGVRYSEVPAHTRALAEALDEELSEKWGMIRGLEMVSLSINSVTASKEDENMIKELQRNAVLRSPGMAAATLTEAQAQAMKAAAANTSAGSMMAFAGMNMAGMTGGMNAGELYGMAAKKEMQKEMQQEEAAHVRGTKDRWECSCGAADNQGKFCGECGKAKSLPGEWVCGCGAANKGNFCTECGERKPE